MNFEVNSQTKKTPFGEVEETVLTFSSDMDKNIMNTLLDITNDEGFYDDIVNRSPEYLYQYWNDIISRAENGNESLLSLACYLSEHFKDKINQYNKMSDDGKITFDNLNKIFTIGTKFVARTTNDQLVGSYVHNTRIDKDMFGEKFFVVIGLFTISSGKEFLQVEKSFSIPEFRGLRNLRDLKVRPLTDGEEEYHFLKKRGDKFTKYCLGTHYLSYTGDMFRQSYYGPTHFKATGRIMIDTVGFKTMNPNYDRSFHNNNKNICNPDIPEDLRFMTWPFTFGFSFTAKQWGEIYVDQIEEIKFDDNAFDCLVLDQDYKEMAKALVTNVHLSFTDIISGKSGGCIFLLHGPPGCGKCHAKDTPILMHDGTIKLVQYVKPGDKLMGDDSEPRNVQSIARGRETMYKVTTVKGDSFVVNESHILSLKDTNRNNVYDISIKEYLNLPKQIRDSSKIYKVGVEFPEKQVEFDPYILGYWLGNKTSHYTMITTNQDRVLKYFTKEMTKHDLYLVKKLYSDHDYYITNTSNGTTYNPKSRNNKFKIFIEKNDLIKNKHIPFDYKSNSRANRLKLLAGILDSDSYNDNNCYQITRKDKRLLEDIVFLARSLGFHADEPKNLNTRYYTTISGEGLEKIPTLIKKTGVNQTVEDALISDFTLEKLPEDDYYGFVIDGNHRYLLGNFIVTHNTLTCEAIAELLHRPLYSITVGELGTNADTLEKKLSVILETANTWNAVILIDEADIFLEKRTDNDIDRNAMVGVFLRLLERHQGVLFLTTNRASSMDEAFRSRISVIIPYEELNETSRNQVWRNLLLAANISLNEESINKLTEYNINGRQIKNAIRMAQCLAFNQSTDVNLEHFKKVIKMM